MVEIITDALLDTLKLVPFLFLTYLFLEWLEHQASHRFEEVLLRSKKAGPLFGSLLGLVPQCGFSSAASSFYVTKVISLGTLLAVYLSTSDEMLPVLLSNQANPQLIFQILALKLGVGCIAGFLVDALLHKKEGTIDVDSFCEEEHCHCESGILSSALVHTAKIAGFILVVNLLLGFVMHTLDATTLASWFSHYPFLDVVLVSFVGLIPNCAASVAITQLYLSGILSFSSLVAGLLTNAGVGLLVLYRVNHKRIRENLLITGLLWLVGVAVGFLLLWI